VCAGTIFWVNICPIFGLFWFILSFFNHFSGLNLFRCPRFYDPHRVRMRTTSTPKACKNTSIADQWPKERRERLVEASPPKKRDTKKNYWKWSLATMICLPKKKLKRQNHCLFHRHSEWAILLPFPNIVQFSLIFLFLRPRTEEEKQNNPQQLDSTTMLPNQRQY